MDSEYDRKFEEMKKYIPFLESMIKRLENTTTTSNPRQAQLDKIRSLRDLLMDKKKRMKMENLLKCEQVLVNLYTKVEQRDSLVGPKKETASEKGTTNLNVVRNKLKYVVSKLHNKSDDTLPEIARASETEEICVPGSKEPALFQRRPNVPCSTPTCQSPSLKKELSPKNVKRNYTRLLLSPERNSTSWSNDEPSNEKPLFIRRSPKNSPRNSLQSYHKKERKKDETNVSQSKDLNITLNVPEESLLSLNTKDIVSRIINCNNNDVDIDTLRELRTQILGELKETGAKDDISDIILKSYKKKDAKDNNEEVEEGELSDSESEAIESIYGSLVIMDKDKSSENVKIETTDNTQCKIQICLVINSDKQNLNSPKDKENKALNFDSSEFETFHKVKERNEQNKVINRTEKDISIDTQSGSKDSVVCSKSPMTETYTEKTKDTVSDDTSDNKSILKEKQDGSDGIECIINSETSNIVEAIAPNFYKPIKEDVENKDMKNLGDKSVSELETEDEESMKTTDDISENVEVLNKKYDVEIPLLDSHTTTQQNIVKDEVSEIDILQALKNEILSATSNVLNTDVVTPLFQPKITKVTNAQEIGCKKRISIEKYKAKTITNAKISPNYVTEAEILKKQSLKLTEKECERFNFLSKLSLDASSDEENKSNVSMDDIYSNLAPKSPDHEDFADKGLKPPVIIPSDPVEIPVMSSEADIDMRSLLPHPQHAQHTQEAASKILMSSPSFGENVSKTSSNENNVFKIIDTQTPHLVDPRMKRESSQLNTQVNSLPNLSSSIHSNSAMAINVCGVSTNLIQNMTPSPNLVPNMTPNRTQNIGNMTPNMTPSRLAFDNDDGLNSKHVYAPTYQSFDNQGYKEKARKSRWGCDNNVPFWEDVGVSRNRSNKLSVWENDLYPRKTSNNIPVWEDGKSRSGSMQRDNDYLSKYDHSNTGPRYDTFNDTRDPYCRTDCITPNRPFNRMDCPPTPTPSFGRIDTPMTPVHSFGRSDCPPTPNHPFGRQEPPNAMSNMYGGPDYNQLATSQNFCNTQDSRFITRNSDYDNPHIRDRDRYNFYESDQNNRYNNSDSYRRFQREQSVTRNERNKMYDQTGRDYREPLMRRETTVGRPYNKDQEGDRSFSRNRGHSRSYDYRHQSESKSYDEINRRGYQHEREASKNTRDSSPSSSHTTPSAGRAISKENKLNVRSLSGHSFTIDTKSTFQENKKNNNSPFDARRQRAASVGRSLVAESSSSRESHESKQFSTMSKNLNKNKNFRRASSVGREIRDSKSDFRDIKASLKSFKLKSDSRVANYFEKQNVSENPTQSLRNSSRKEIHEADNKSFNNKGKYSPRKNDRDPRVRRESYDIKSKYRNQKRSNSRDSKNCGIVYSNDNISKGTILGSGYGVKNYKIPKIKRSVEVPESSSNTNSNIEGNVKEQIKNEHNIVEENVEEEKKHLPKKSRDTGLIEIKNTTGNSKQNQNNNEKKVQKNSNILPDALSDSNDQNKELKNAKQEECEDEIITETSFENNNRRMTRSARKKICEDKSLLEISPVRRTRKSKKTFLIESDSDDNDIKNSITKMNSSDLNKSSDMESDKEKQEENLTNVSSSEIPSNTLETPNIVCNDNKKLDTKNENPSKTTQLSLNAIEKQEKSLLASEEESSNSFNIKDLDNYSKNVKAGGLESNFGMDDLEIFSDNITSDPVIDNINALIADLDDDLESNKNIESKSQFTQELNMETMLENISNPDICNTKNDLSLSESTELSVDKSLNVTDVGKAVKDLCDKNRLEICSVSTSDEKALSNKEAIENICLKTEQFKNLPISDCVSDTVSKIQDDTTTKVLDHNTDEDNNHNEGVVSTTDIKELPKTQYKNGDVSKDIIDNAIHLTAPDSTIHNTDIVETDIQRNIPQSTDKLANDMMNSDVTSTHNANVASNKDVSEPVLSNTDSSEIENIGKLLSILQDKSKIKELLGLLGDQSNENDKIKKKLEKLSEIVSDDEDSTKDNLEKKSVVENVSNVTIDETEPMQQSSKINEAEAIPNTIDSGNNVDFKNEIKNKEEGSDGVLDLPDDKTDTDDTRTVPMKIEEEPVDKEQDQNTTVDNFKSNNKKTVKNTVCKKGKKKTLTKNIKNEERRLTRSDAPHLRIETPILKKPSRELENLQRDIKEMFIRDDIHNATGIRMCRIAKLVDEKRNTKQNNPEFNQNENEPVVVLKKCKNVNESEETVPIERPKKIKANNSIDSDIICKTSKNSDTKFKENNKIDPYDFETESIKEVNNTSDKHDEGSESDFESMCSSRSFGSTELLTEIKRKPKRKRGKGWKAGIIKCKKKKTTNNRDDTLFDDKSEVTKPGIDKPDLNCFIDKTYCFNKQITNYDCRLCVYNGVDIVNHYKKQHPHTEIPCARMSPSMAQEAIKESEEVNFQAISGISSKKYVCRFCFKEFSKKKPLIEAFFWHVVSMHTGEYKQLCSECVNINSCPFNIDIPPPPKDAKGQLLGYICEKCNYTQISLENLKTHVILRHNDEQTAVYTINLAVMTKKSISTLFKQWEAENVNNETDAPRVLRSSRSNQSLVDNATEETPSNVNKTLLNDKAIEASSENKERIFQTNNIQSKITFENDIMDDITNYQDIKIENESEQDVSFNLQSEPEPEPVNLLINSENSLSTKTSDDAKTSDDIFSYPHFKIMFSNTGSKDYICCINGNDHYRTTLLISLKKHVQLKHSEQWDGYCFVCKVIVTPQGKHVFKDCLQHFLDKHIDNFPILEETSESTLNVESMTTETDSDKVKSGVKPYINVRPISELISNECNSEKSDTSVLPVIESVISLGTTIAQAHPSPSYPTTDNSSVIVTKHYKYEEAQAEMMTKKHRVVLDVMMSEIKLGHVFKCAGRFCSFTTDSAEDALLHASTHARLGGEDALNCVYCDFDSHQNAIDLITHVFKSHGSCQYLCGQCFYRAAASQLVNAHIKRVHEASMPVVIFRTTFKTAANIEDKILSREQAVPHYICCGDSGTEGLCKFRTYTPGKFCEHLQLRHGSNTELKCFMCTSNFKTPADLIRHLKTHGLKLYQCSWCIHGADNESELLAHASAFHPNQQPQAYLRIITNKEGSSELRVLPLAHLNKSDILAVDIVPSKFKDNPVREAERSIELEKLIGQSTLMIESMASVDENTNAKEVDSTLNNESTLTLDNANILKPSESTSITPRTSTPIPDDRYQTEGIQKQHQIKTEQPTPEKNTKATEVVYCIDSDEDAASKNNIESNNKSVDKQIKVPLANLFLCAKCKMVLNTGIGLKRHMFWCYATVSDPVSCAHCSIKIPKADLLNHYLEVHSVEGKNQKKICSKCSREFSSISQLRAHRKAEHSNQQQGKTITTANKGVDESALANIKQYPPGSGKIKRPLCSKEKTTEPPEKMRKFGPQDVDQLPINPILDDLVFCALCEFNTKVRLNMVRHLQLHAQQQPAPHTAPVNPVPHLETNEKHFDKMVNLASSSIVTRTPDKNKTDNNTAAVSLPPEVASRFPKYVPEKHRLTCGARGCSYTSVDEAMLKYHWETLHQGSTDFHCVHCPPRQNLDMSQPLTLPRIMAHLKMHDSKLYACSFCTYYHHKREIVQKHLNDVHKGGQVMIVREGTTGAAAAVPAHTPAPTMDLKPWHCGLCSFKSLLRPEVVDHCAKEHNSKMQYKCAFCAFRTSNAENITKHQSKSHPNRPEEIFYYYYREGSVPDEPDGTERWQRQSQKSDNTESPAIKSETSSNTPPPLQPLSKSPADRIDLNLVKKEIIEPVDETIEDLCRDFGEFCEPNGLKYKCSLCKNVIEDDIEAIQSHLYEELKYRKWGCSICSYKAFHKAGLSEHMIMEHGQNRDPIALQVDHRVEMWVNKLLEHQTALIEKYKDNLVQQKAEIFRSNPGPSTSKPQSQAIDNVTNQTSNASNKSIEELEKLFGSFGTPVNGSFRCPKCEAIFRDEDLMHNHLEGELNKIRWYCSACFVTFQTYHTAQFHCRSAHVALRPAARPAEAPRDAGVRAAWLRTALAVQRLTMQDAPPGAAPVHLAERPVDHAVPEDSLLVVRYEENVPTPEVHVRSDHDSDDEKLVIDEPTEKRTSASHTCSLCGYVSHHTQQFRTHTLKHYNLKPFDCGYCSFNGIRRSVVNHMKKFHAPRALLILPAKIPTEAPLEYAETRRARDEDGESICLVCQHTLPTHEIGSHSHGNAPPIFGKKGDIVVKCNVCLSIHKDISSLTVHHATHHPNVDVNYSSTKLRAITVMGTDYKCHTCPIRFTSLKDLRLHMKTKCKQTKRPMKFSSDMIIDLDDEEEVQRKRRILDSPSLPNKKVAKKSTTKLPHSRFARKSTTKLPFDTRNEEEYSFYGTAPATDDLHDITTMMPFCNTMVPFTLKKLNEIININPVVVVDKLKVYN